MFKLCRVTLLSLMSMAPLWASQIHKPIENKIVGGVESDIRKRPYVVSLQRSNNRHFCGGSLIAPQYVLTAAHCVSKSSVGSVKVVLYSQTANASDPQSEQREIVKVVSHPKYSRFQATPNHDFAVLKLERASRFEPVSLSYNKEIDTLNNDDNDEEQSLMSTALGWGTTSENGSLSGTLMEVRLPLVSKQECQKAYPRTINESMICAGFRAGGKDSCQGDSGGPLVVSRGNGKDELVGVVSWGEGCARPNKFGVYGKVAQVTHWIEGIISE